MRFDEFTTFKHKFLVCYDIPTQENGSEGEGASEVRDCLNKYGVVIQKSVWAVESRITAQKLCDAIKKISGSVESRILVIDLTEIPAGGTAEHNNMHSLLEFLKDPLTYLIEDWLGPL